ncbi:hypothetical protein QJS10_CPB13g00439 [Acorus calamus]|uniref:Uncharacterized protein n=1 Tax=Acorus calamus TaxID=4465 RepID=A0AAV9DGF9_ACOCL|nr:hypothetical protein QJS10_CPB13g00439 [Acorus calamus]
MMSSFSFSAKARPLKSFNEVKEGLGVFIDGLSVWGIKSAGPNPGGKGHMFTTVDVVGWIKNSGPSPGNGHQAQVSSNGH